MNFDALHSDTRRAFARAELRKRGLSIEEDDPRLEAAFKGLREAVAKLPGYLPPNGFSASVELLRDRIDLGTITTLDKLLLASIPSCCMTAEALVQMFSDLHRAY